MPNSVLTLALNSGGCSMPRPSCFTPGKSPDAHWRRLDWPQSKPGWDLHQWSHPRPSSL